MKTVIVVNGRPRAGKDTTIGFMMELLGDAGVPTSAFSSIDPVRDMLAHAGIDVSRKTPEDRDLLAAIGMAVETHSNWRTKQCVNRAAEFFESHAEKAVMFLHVRERSVIERVGALLQSHPRGPFKLLKVYVASPRAIIRPTNAADMDVDEVVYDYSIENNTTLDDLRCRSEKALVTLGVIEQLSLLHN